MTAGGRPRPEPASAAWLGAVRTAYDLVAERYADLLRDELADRPVERRQLTSFLSLVDAAGGGWVLDAGCGSGRLPPHLAGPGRSVVGLDLSAGMLAVARRDHPGSRLVLGSMTAAPLAAASFAGIVARYSVIHVPPDEQVPLLDGVAGLLRPGGLLLVGFRSADDEHVHLANGYGQAVSLDVWRLSEDRVAGLLRAARLVAVTRTVRAAEPRSPPTRRSCWPGGYDPVSW